MMRPLLADLHTHSSASDGQYAPAELAALAKDRGLEVLALTDHDTVDGLEEAVRMGEALGLRVLTGIEFGAKEDRHLHILGYGFSFKDPALQALCAKLRGGRDERKYRIIDYLKEKDIHISLDEVEELAGGDVIARPHFAQVMVRHGYVSSTWEAFERYLDTDEFQKIERFKAEAALCIETIKNAGGRAALAHPHQLKLPDRELESLVKTLADAGLDALECYYPLHTPAQTAFYLKLAEEYGLHVTGGSDFHGERVKPEIKLAAVPLDLDWLL